MSAKANKLILLDADVVSHFISGGQFGLLPQIFTNKKVILDIVATELRVAKKFRTVIDNAVSMGFIKEISFQKDKLIVFEYAQLIKRFGKGESACMAYCKCNKDILASSNLKDIVQYCTDNGIAYLTTMDFLAEAMKAKQLTEQECNNFIKDVKAAGSKLPVNTIADYLKNYTVRGV